MAATRQPSLEEELEKIKLIDDFDDAEEMADELNVSMDGCQDLDDIKQRLELHVKETHGIKSNLTEAVEVMTHVRQAEDQRRQELRELCQGVKDLVVKAKQDSLLRKQLQKEGLLAADEDSKQLVSDLAETKCPIVFAGETSSGKSTMMNLFLGKEEILPSHTLSCTSTICEIRYGNKPEANLVFPNGTKRSIPFEDRKCYMVRDYKTRSEQFEHECVELFYPIKLMKDGITFVDTPGIGENSTMRRVLLDYIGNHDIYGFVYIIKSDNAGGVAKDRLVYLLQQLRSLEDKGGGPKFDARAAIFVCNKWDLVPKFDREEVKKDTIRKLKECWHGFDENRQLFFMNSKMALQHWAAGCVADDYSELLHGIEYLFPLGLETRTLNVYWWVEMVLRRLMHPLRVCMQRRGPSQRERDMISKIEIMLQGLQEYSRRFSAGFTKLLQSCKDALVDHVRSYLHSSDADRGITTWKLRDVPKANYGEKWDTMEERLTERVESRMARLVTKWENKRHCTRRAQERLLQYLRKHSTHLQMKLDDIEKLIENVNAAHEILEGTDHEEFALTFDEDELEMLVSDFESHVKEAVHVIDSAHPRITQKINETVAYNTNMFTPMMGQRINGSQYEYEQNPVQFMSSFAGSSLVHYRKAESIRKLVNYQLKHIESFAGQVIKRCEHVIGSDISVLSYFAAEQTAPDFSFYRNLEGELLEMLHKTIEFKCRSIQKYPLSACDFILKNTHGQRITEYLASLHPAYDQKRGVNVTIKTYSSIFRAMDRMEEERNHRKYHRHHRCIASLHGTFKDKSGLPAVVFAENLVPARAFYMSRSARAKRKGEFTSGYCLTFIQNMISVLEFLHQHSLIHYGLTLDSVTVDANTGNVRITTVGHCRPVPLKGTDILNDLTTYMPQEVLQGYPYTQSADIYCLALLLLELYFDQVVFAKFRKLKVSNFVEVITNSDQAVLRQLLGVEVMPDGLKQLIISCVSQDPEQRPTIRNVNSWWKSVSRSLR